jgi:hypothetical protein
VNESLNEYTSADILAAARGPRSNLSLQGGCSNRFIPLRSFYIKSWEQFGNNNRRIPTQTMI